MERARPHLTVAVIVAMVVPLTLIAVCREPAPAPKPAAVPVAVPVLSPAKIKPEPARPQPPTRSVMCLAPDVTLFPAEQNVVVCWANGVCGDEEGARTERPAAAAPTALRVETTRVCTADKCDPLGAKLQRAVADADGDAVDASHDHSLVMVGDAVWNRTRDRLVAAPSAKTHGWDHEGDLLGGELLGTHVLVAREWWPDQVPPPPWMPARATILDASGKTCRALRTTCSRSANDS